MYAIRYETKEIKDFNQIKENNPDKIIVVKWLLKNNIDIEQKTTIHYRLLSQSVNQIIANMPYIQWQLQSLGFKGLWYGDKNIAKLLPADTVVDITDSRLHGYASTT